MICGIEIEKFRRSYCLQFQALYTEQTRRLLRNSGIYIYGHGLKYKKNGLTIDGLLCNRMSVLEMNTSGSEQCPVTDLVLPGIFYGIIQIKCCRSCPYTKFYNMCQWMCLEWRNILMCEHEAAVMKDKNIARLTMPNALIQTTRNVSQTRLFPQRRRRYEINSADILIVNKGGK
jgi:hypothetical protein